MGQHVETNKMNFVVFFIGVVLGVIAITVMHWCRVAYERGTWAATMVAIAAFYMVFSIEHSLGETQQYRYCIIIFPARNTRCTLQHLVDRSCINWAWGI